MQVDAIQGERNDKVYRGRQGPCYARNLDQESGKIYFIGNQVIKLEQLFPLFLNAHLGKLPSDFIVEETDFFIYFKPANIPRTQADYHAKQITN